MTPMPTPRRWRAFGEVYVAPPAAPSERAFGVTVGLVLIAMAAFTGWRGHLLRAEILGVIGALLLLAGLVVPRSLRVLAKVWSRIGHALGWVNSRVLLTLMFVLVVCPVALVSRLFGGDLLDTRRRTGSFWVAYSSRIRDPKHFDRLF
jgi:Saxitoxin biosynthesis operon protein SxtJ